MGVFENQEPLNPEVARVYKPKCIKLKKKTFGLESLTKVCKIENKLLKNGNIIVINVRTAKYISKICLEYAIARCQV